MSCRTRRINIPGQLLGRNQRSCRGSCRKFCCTTAEIRRIPLRGPRIVCRLRVKAGFSIPSPYHPNMPLDAHPFLAAILEQPDDDGPRLVYADWLEEQGQSDRAELI